jgi:CSLREA domain-containing protein
VAFALGSPLAHAATRTVTKVADTNDGVCNADCSLREAISVAAPGDEIVFATPLFSSARTIVLAEANGFRELVISKSLTIRGPGADLLTLQPAPQVSQPPFRIFNFTGASVDVTLQGMTITGGRTFVGNGGGINVTGGAVLLVSQCHVTGNLARAGGGLYASSDSSLTVLNSTVSGNSDLGFDGSGGGGIHNEGNLFISGSTISGNVTGAGSQPLAASGAAERAGFRIRRSPTTKSLSQRPQLWPPASTARPVR